MSTYSLKSRASASLLGVRERLRQPPAVRTQHTHPAQPLHQQARLYFDSAVHHIRNHAMGAWRAISQYTQAIVGPQVMQSEAFGKQVSAMSSPGKGIDLPEFEDLPEIEIELEPLENEPAYTPLVAAWILKTVKGDDAGFSSQFKLADGSVIQVAMVADGVGSSDAVLLKCPDEKLRSVSGAALTAKYLRDSIVELTLKDPTLFAEDFNEDIYDEVARLMTLKLRALYHGGSEFKNKVKSIASTLSFVVTRTHPKTGQISLKMFCVGDSPVIIVAPGKLYIHCDKHPKNHTSAICLFTEIGEINDGKDQVVIREIELPAGTPYIVMAMTDGMLEIENGLEGLLAFLKEAHGANEATDLIAQFRRWEAGRSLDDTTLAVALSAENKGLSVSQILGDGYVKAEI